MPSSLDSGISKGSEKYELTGISQRCAASGAAFSASRLQLLSISAENTRKQFNTLTPNDEDESFNGTIVTYIHGQTDVQLAFRSHKQTCFSFLISSSNSRLSRITATNKDTTICKQERNSCMYGSKTAGSEEPVNLQSLFDNCNSVHFTVSFMHIRTKKNFLPQNSRQQKILVIYPDTQ